MLDHLQSKSYGLKGGSGGDNNYTLFPLQTILPTTTPLQASFTLAPKKKIRRGRKPGKTENQRANSGLSSFLYANANGYRSKKESINQIIEEHDIDVIMLNETKVYSKSAIKIKGFQSFPVVRNKNKGGGAFMGVRHGCVSQL